MMPFQAGSCRFQIFHITLSISDILRPSSLYGSHNCTGSTSQTLCIGLRPYVDVFICLHMSPVFPSFVLFTCASCLYVFSRMHSPKIKDFDELLHFTPPWCPDKTVRSGWQFYTSSWALKGNWIFSTQGSIFLKNSIGFAPKKRSNRISKAF